MLTNFSEELSVTETKGSLTFICFPGLIMDVNDNIGFAINSGKQSTQYFKWQIPGLIWVVINNDGPKRFRKFT